MKNTESELTNFCHQAGPPVVDIGCCIRLNCWPRVSSGDPQTTSADARIEGDSLKTDGRNSLSLTASTAH